MHQFHFQWYIFDGFCGSRPLLPPPYFRVECYCFLKRIIDVALISFLAIPYGLFYPFITRGHFVRDSCAAAKAVPNPAPQKRRPLPWIFLWE